MRSPARGESIFASIPSLSVNTIHPAPEINRLRNCATRKLVIGYLLVEWLPAVATSDERELT